MAVPGQSPYESLLSKHSLKLGDVRSTKMRRCLFRIQTDYSSPEGMNEGSGAYNVTYRLTSQKHAHETSTVDCSCVVSYREAILSEIPYGRSRGHIYFVCFALGSGSIIRVLWAQIRVGGVTELTVGSTKSKIV